MKLVRGSRLHRLSLLLVLPLAVSAVAAPAADAAAPKASGYSVAITSPSSLTTQVGDRTTFALKVTNGASSSNDIGSIQVVVPAAFGSVVPGTATVPSGFVYSLPACSADSPVGCGATGTTLVQVSTPNISGATKIGAGQSLTFFINATARAKGAPVWATQAKNSAAWSTGQLLSKTGSDPVVTVYGAPSKLAFTALPPTEVTAGQTFGSTVTVLDVDGAPTPSTASVSLSATGLGGTTTVSAVSGTATFSGLKLTTAGTITVTASSTDLTSAAATVKVKPGPPADLVVAGPSAAVAAGGAFGVAVTVTDLYSNAVDNPEVTVTGAVDGTVQDTKLTVAGSTTVDLTAPTTLGAHTYTVASGTLSETFDLTVKAAPATHLTIDSVTDQAGVGTLTKNAPFDVVITARDDFENPSPYNGTVTLATSGGTGSGLGTLGGTTTVELTNSSTATVRGAVYSGYGNSIQLTANAVPSSGSLDTPISGSTTIDVSLFATVKTGSPGQSLTLSNAACANATPGVPICSSLLLPNGANGKVTLSQSVCDPFTPCLVGQQNTALLVNGVADLRNPTTGLPLYTRTNPAAVELRCDKTLCGGAGVNSFPILFQPTGSATFAEAPPCPSKGRIGPNQDFCQDFRQNNRDNAGDLIAYVLFTEDLKTTLR